MRSRAIHSVGTWVETKNRYVRVKVAPGKWEGLGAHLLKRSGIPINEGDRVFFADGDRENRSIENLRRIHFNTTPVILLSTSRVIPTPPKYRVMGDGTQRRRIKMVAA